MKAFSTILFIFILITAVASCDCGDDDDDNDSGETPVDDDTGDDDVGDDDVADDDTVDDDTSDDDTSDDDTGDDDTTPSITCYRDEDLDSYGDAGNSQNFSDTECPAGWVEDDNDCDDTEAFINPEAFDYPDDGIDQNCDESDFSRSDDNGIFVTIGGNDGNPGTMASPMLTVSAAVTAAGAAGKSVFVGAGGFNENVTTSVSIFGGYETTGWTRDIISNQTLVESVGINPTIAILAGSKADRVYLDGLTVQGGHVGTSSRGVQLQAGASADIYRCSINGGKGSSNSYGVVMEGDSLVIRNSAIEGSYDEVNNAYAVIVNTGALELYDSILESMMVSYSGYGVVVNGGEALLVRNEITGGETCLESYAVKVEGSATLINNVLNGGSSMTDSAALFVNYGEATAINNYFFGGDDVSTAYGVKIENESTMVLANNIIDGGTFAGTIAGIHLNANSNAVSLYNNDIWGDDMVTLVSSDADYDDIADVNACTWTGCEEASDNISDDPAFDSGDLYHLLGTSPCIDEGLDPSELYEGVWIYFDWDYDGRPEGEGWDIGVDEYVAK